MWSRGPRAHATVVHGCTMRHTAEAVPPRCPGHHKLAHERTDRYASQRSGRRTGQCSHAQTDAARLDCPRLALGCQAMFWPPVGAATRSNSRCALPHLAAPQGAHEGRHRRRCALPVPWIPLAPSPPHGGFANRCAPEGRRLRRPRRGRRPPPCTELFGLHLTLCGLSFLLAWFRNVMPEVSGVKARPRCVYQQDGPHGVAASEGVSGGPRGSVASFPPEVI